MKGGREEPKTSKPGVVHKPVIYRPPAEAKKDPRLIGRRERKERRIKGKIN